MSELSYLPPYAGPTTVVSPTEHERTKIAGVGLAGALAGYLFARKHHPLVWLGLGVGIFLAVRVVLSLWPYLLLALALVIVAHLYRSGWSPLEIAGGAAGLAGTAAVTAGVLFLAGIGPAIVALAGVVALWWAFGPRRCRGALTETESPISRGRR